MAGTITDRLTAQAERTGVDITHAARPGLIFGVLCGVWAFARVGIPGGLNRIWVDDGKFLAAAIEEPWTAVAHAHHGYLNVSAGISASIAALLPLELAPIVFGAIWAAAVGFVAWFVADMSTSLFDRAWPPTMLGVGVALMPVAAFESLGNVTYIGWYLLAAATIALVAEPRRERMTATVVVMAMLSAPASVALAPLIWWRRDRRPVMVGWLGALAVQGAVVVTDSGEREVAGGWLQFDEILPSFVGASLNSLTARLVDPTLLSPLSVILVVVVALVVHRERGRLMPAVTLVGAGLTQWWFTYGGAENNHAYSQRYMLVPAILALTFVLRAVEGNRLLAAGITIALACCWIGSFFALPVRAQTGEEWRPQLDRVECVDGFQLISAAPNQSFDLPCD